MARYFLFSVISSFVALLCLAQEKLLTQDHREQVFAEQIPPKGLFDPLLERLQTSASAHLKQLHEAPETKETLPYAVSIENDLRHLKNLWTGLHANPNAKNVTAYCEKIFNKAKAEIQTASSEEIKKSTLKDASERIGQAVFLAERCLNEMPSLINPASFTLSNLQIRLHCMKEIKKLTAKCKAYWDAQKEAGLQDPDLSLKLLEAQVIARILLTNSGQLNLGMISFVRTAFVPKNPLNNQLGVTHVLSTMNSSWQPVIDDITKPASSNYASQEVLRADLGLSRKIPLNPFHSKWAALKALFSLSSQETSRDCFASAWTMKKPYDYFMQSLKDYGELLNYGYLTRMVDGYPDQFYFKTSLADEALQASVTLASSGLLDDKILLWNIPAIVAACRQMGIDDVQGVTCTAIKNLFKNGSDSTQITPAKIIDCFASYANLKNKQRDPQQRFRQGQYGFCVTQNHLLRAWETALVGMAEVKKNNYARSKFHSSVQLALQNTWSTLKANLPREGFPLAIQMQKTFEEMLHRQSRFVYNAAITWEPTSSGGYSTKSGFELYKRQLNQPYTIGQRVATPDDFRTFLIELAHLASTSLAQTFHSTSEILLLEEIASGLTHSMKQENFLHAAFCSYDEPHTQVVDPVTNYLQLEKTPMTILGCDHPYAAEIIDLGISFLQDVKTIPPKNPYALIKWILDLAKWKDQTQWYLRDSSLDQYDPAMNPQQAFAMIFEEQDVKTFVNSNETSDRWLYNQIIQPSLFIAQAPVDDHFKETFTNHFIEWLQQNTLLSNSTLISLETIITQINRHPMTMQEYASCFFHQLDHLIQADESSKRQLSFAFDSLFLQTLPAAVTEQLSHHAIRFAKPNWNPDGLPLSFCVFLNPRTASLAFGTLAEDRTYLNILDE